MYEIRRFFIAIPVFVIGFLGLLLSGCSAVVPPAYLDYNKIKPDEKSLTTRIETVLQSEGWKLTPSVIPDVITTEEKVITDLVAYKLLASLEVLQMGNNRVRVLVHIVRKYRLSGTRSKLPYLERHIKKAVIVPLTERFKAAGIERS